MRGKAGLLYYLRSLLGNGIGGGGEVDQSHSGSACLVLFFGSARRKSHLDQDTTRTEVVICAGRGNGGGEKRGNTFSTQKRDLGRIPYPKEGRGKKPPSVGGGMCFTSSSFRCAVERRGAATCGCRKKKPGVESSFRVARI